MTPGWSSPRWIRRMPRLTAASSLDLSAITSPRPAHFPPWTSGSVARGCLPQPLAYRSPPPLCNRDRRSHRPRQDGPGEGAHRRRYRPLGGGEAARQHHRPRSRVRWDESVATSVVTAEGLADLRDALRRVAGDLVERPADDLFRLPIDRVFAVAGAGTVVTGSTWSGSVRVGDTVQLLPLGREARVRSIEVHSQTAERAVPGRRTALALVGVDKSDLTRGHVAVTGPGWQATKLIDVAAELLPTARKPLASRTRVRVHLGTAEVLARAVQTRAIGPGQRGMARLMLETPVVARGGDRFVLRSFSPVTTIGGGVVLDPFSPPHTRLRRRRLSLEQGRAGWRPALDARATDASERLAQRLADARWQVPTVAELEREFPDSPVRALLSHFARNGTAEPIDAERYAAKGALAEFRAALEAALVELGPATPAVLRDRLGLTRKYLIPLLEWADRRGVTRRAGDARVLARLTAGKGGS